MKQHTKPCAECPFRRDIKPGLLGGSPVETYVGQSVLPFWLPCHCDKNYAFKASKFDEVTQCAGTAIFRANLGVSWLMPKSLLNLPGDTQIVFGSVSQFVAHHKGISLKEAREFLSGDKMYECIMKESVDPKMKIIEKGGKMV